MGGLTENEKNMLFKAVFFCNENPPKINYAKLAEMCGYKNTNTAATCYSTARKKALAGTDESAATSPATKKGKGSGGKKRTASADGGDDEENAEETKPAPKKRAGKKAKTGKVKGELEDEDGSDPMDELLKGANDYVKSEDGEEDGL